MKPETVTLLCIPGTHERVSLELTQDDVGNPRQMLVGVDSGKAYEIRAGIPILLDPAQVTGYNQHYQDLYNRTAGMYDAGIRLISLLSGGEKRSRMAYLSELELEPGARVLEVSIGTGANLHYLPQNAEYYGLDLSWGMLMRCQRNFSGWKQEAELIMGNAEDLPLIDHQFDVVFHVGGINAFNDRTRAIAEMVRVAKPGSKIVIVDETYKTIKPFEWLPSIKDRFAEHKDRFTAPVDFLPDDVQEVTVRSILSGYLYCLTFRTPGW